jgi:hypothetical protein
MRRILFSVILIFAVSTISAAQNTTLILLEGLSSKMSTGTPFTAKDASSGKLYKGYVVTHPARRLLRPGSMIHRPDCTCYERSRRGIQRWKQDEVAEVGRLHRGRKLADDAVDGAIGCES